MELMTFVERDGDVKGCQFVRSRSFNPFVVRSGGKWYTVDSIKFYKPDGTVAYSTNWFTRNGGSNNPYEGVKLADQPEEILRRSVKQIKYDGKVFGVVVNIPYDTEKRLDVYIPISYLESLGGGEQPKVRKNLYGDGKDQIWTNYVTPYFEMTVKIEYVDHFEDFKAELLAKLQACQDREQLKEFAEFLKYKA
jgi:hypothetical protein